MTSLLPDGTQDASICQPVTPGKVTVAEEGSQFMGANYSQQEKFSMVKIESYEGLLK